MKIDFETGDAGFFEARAVHRAVHEARGAVHESAAREFLGFLDEAAALHLRQPMFDALRQKHGMGDESWPNFSVLKHLWRQTLGSSQLESNLSEQRSEALERAERAEHSAFEALAEAARVERERDRALTEVAQLKSEVARLAAQLTSSGDHAPGD